METKKMTCSLKFMTLKMEIIYKTTFQQTNLPFSRNSKKKINKNKTLFKTHSIAESIKYTKTVRKFNIILKTILTLVGP